MGAEGAEVCLIQFRELRGLSSRDSVGSPGTELGVHHQERVTSCGLPAASDE